MPIETKNRMEKASRNGSRSEAMRWLNGDSLTTAPARKAPKAKETPNNKEEPSAMPSEIANIAKMNNSRERVWATRNNNQGMKRLPANSMNTMKPSAAIKAVPIARQSVGTLLVLKFGMTSNIKTVAISSITRQPTATLPCEVFNSPKSIKPRNMTIVLAMETAKPSITPAKIDHPQYQLSAKPKACIVTI